MIKNAFSYEPTLRPAFLAHLSARLDAVICSQCQPILRDAGVETPVLSVSVMMFLFVNGQGSVADIARIDGQSHQLVKSRLKPIEVLGFVQSKTDPLDGRRSILSLTDKGKADAKRVYAVSYKIARAIEELQKEIGVDLTDAVMRAEKKLKQFPLIERMTNVKEEDV